MSVSNKAKIREDAMSLNPMDDALFQKMAENKDFCQEILQVILSDKELVVLSVNPQFVVKNLQGRSCMLDAKCQLGNGKIVNIEVQKSDDDDHQRRVRFNGALLTANLTDPGSKFKQVPDVIVVFISKFDIFKSQRSLYHVDRVIRETGKIVENGFTEIYVNAEANDNSDVSELMNVFVKGDAYDDAKFPVTSACKRRYKTTEEGVREMCEVIERNRAEGREEGRAEGLAKGLAKGRIEERTNLVVSMLKNKMKPEQIAQIAQMTVEQIVAIGRKAAVL